MGLYRWVFFDLFDTLCTVDEDIYYAGKREAAKAANLDYNDFMRAWRDTSPHASTGVLKTPYARAEKALALLGVWDRRTAAEISRLDVDTIQQCVRFYDGAQDALGTLRERGFSLGLISNATATTAFAIGPLNLRLRIDQLVFSYEVGAAKPEPRIYEAALGRAGCKAADALFVGDGANRELDAARAAGFGTVCMDHPSKAHTFRNPESLSAPDHRVVHGFSELLGLPSLAGPADDD